MEAHGPPSMLSLDASTFSLTSEQTLKLQERKLTRRRKVNFVISVITLVSSTVAAIAYAVLWITLIPPLKLTETGNLYVFILFLIVCSVLGICSLMLCICHLRGADLRYKHALGFDLLLSISFVGVLLLLIGGSEKVSKNCHRTNGISGACVGSNVPKVTTEFGKYIDRVCGMKFGIRLEDVKVEDWKYLSESGHRNIPSYMQTDPVRCHATNRLKTIIFSMAGYGVELFLLALVDATLGLGNYRV